MRFSPTLLAALPLAAALPSQLVFDVHEPLDSLDSAKAYLGELGQDVANLAQEYARGPGLTVIKQATSDPAFGVVSSEAVPHTLRIKETTGLCDTSVKQHSGYLDFDSKHLFFWFFESRGDPSNDPLVLWLNGGPGCSSTTGLFFELGPCNILPNGTSTEYNPYSWTEKANVIFLDSPIATGFSYSDSGDTLNNSHDVGVDVYAFLQLFYTHFPEYAKLPFHLTGESYNGHYLPAIATEINEQNKKIRPQLSAAKTSNAPVPKSHLIPFESIALGNGNPDPFHQYPAYADFACKPSETAVWDEKTCATVRSKLPTCLKLIQSCYDNESPFACLPANLYCQSNIRRPMANFPVNPYNVKVPCDRKGADGPGCYREDGWIATYLNRPEVKQAVGAPAELTFVGCNEKVNDAFFLTGDHMRNAAKLLPPLLDDGIRILVYAGDFDWVCNWLGNLRWFLALDTPFKDELNAQKPKTWRNLNDDKIAGEILSGGGGNFTFARVYAAGHMVPHDQPSHALDLISRWLEAEPLA